MEFRISIGACNEIFVYVEPTDEEYDLLVQCVKNGEYTFDGVKGLEKLYKRVCKAAYKEMAESIYYDEDVIKNELGGEYNSKAALEYVKNTYSIEPCIPEEMMDMEFDDEEEEEDNSDA